MHSDFSLFVQAILKCALVTGIGPGLAMFLFLEWRRRVKVYLESTSKVVELNGVPARIWEGQRGKIEMLGNGVPYFMGLALAKAVRLAISPAKTEVT